LLSFLKNKHAQGLYWTVSSRFWALFMPFIRFCLPWKAFVCRQETWCGWAP
jgi:hypothetical protein